jgi:NAD+ synthase
MFEIRNEYGLIFSNIKKQFTSYLNDNKQLKSLVVGLSGGIDSALTCILVNEIIKDIPNIHLIGRSLPIETNKEDEIIRGREVGRLFCDEFETIDLTGAYKDFYKGIVTDKRNKDTSVKEKIRRGNVKARIRMIYLFDLAHFNDGMVLSTDNLTELMLGFWTLHGDVGNFGLLQYLWKTEVYGLAGYFEKKYRKRNENDRADALRKSIDAIPTDGLGITSSDFDQIQVPDYETADIILMDYINGSSTDEDHPVIKRYKSTEFKRHDPLNINREDLFIS